MNHIEKLKKLCLEPFYQCHVDGEINSCVLDEGTPWDCNFTSGRKAKITDKCRCEHWKPVDPNPNIAAVLGPLAPELFALWEVMSEEFDPDYGLHNIRRVEDALDNMNDKAAEVLK